MPMYRERTKRIEAIVAGPDTVVAMRRLGIHCSPDGWGVIEGRIRQAVAPGEVVVVEPDGSLKVVQPHDLDKKYELDG